MRPNTLKALPTVRTEISETVFCLFVCLIRKDYCSRSHAGLWGYKDEKLPISTPKEAHSLQMKQRNILIITMQCDEFSVRSKFRILWNQEGKASRKAKVRQIKGEDNDWTRCLKTATSWPHRFHKKSQDGKIIPIKGNCVCKHPGLREYALCKELMIMHNSWIISNTQKKGGEESREMTGPSPSLTKKNGFHVIYFP